MANVLFNPDPLIAWCREQKAILERQIDMLSKGTMRTSIRRLARGDEDTTQQSLDEARRRLAELDRVLAGSEPPGFQRQITS